MKSTRPRALSLDALRGFAVLGMVLSGAVPFFHQALPAWMYHAQVPPPEHLHRPDIIGITWVDVVFPLFLFALGAAIPLALWPRLQAGESRWRLGWGAVVRGLLLIFFALYKEHLTAASLTNVYGSMGYGISIGAFMLLFLIFCRWPASWPKWFGVLLRMAGWASAIALLATLRYPDNGTFSLQRYDPILVILGNVVIMTTLVWLAWPYRIMGRMLIVTVVALLYVARHFTGWGWALMELHALRDAVGDEIYQSIIWAIRPSHQYYLMIAIPGTVAGDILLTWLRPGDQRLSFNIRNSRWRSLSGVQCLSVAIVCAALVIGTITGLTLNDWPATCVLVAVLCGLGLLMLYSSPVKRQIRPAVSLRGQAQVPALMFQRMFVWGAVFLGIGLAAYLWQGVLKDPATLSYFFITAGLAFMVLIVFSMITEAMHRPGLLFLLIDNGQNPMIAYVAAGMFVVPLLQLLPAGGGESVLDWLVTLTQGPWPSFGRAAGITLLVAVVVSVFTRLRIFWRT